jgi:hypothetical protein
MCRHKSTGRARCKVNTHVVNAKRRDRYHVKTAAAMVDTVIAEHGAEFVGDVEGIGFEINSPLVAKAYALAVKAHAGVKRSKGDPYIDHPLRVSTALQKAGFNHEVIAVALLHDAVEDSDMTLGTLRRHGFSERIISGVDSVTKRDGETYESAIERASAHPIGRLVKLSDNLDNSSDEQLAPFSPQKQEKQRAKYIPARVKLKRSILENPVETILDASKGFHQGYRIKISTEVISSIFDGN